MTSTRGSHFANFWLIFNLGGADETRTRDPMRDRHVF